MIRPSDKLDSILRAKVIGRKNALHEWILHGLIAPCDRSAPCSISILAELDSLLKKICCLVGQRVVGMLAKHPLCHVSDEAFRIGQGGKGVGKRPRRTAGGPTCLADGQGQVVMRKIPVQRNASAGNCERKHGSTLGSLCGCFPSTGSANILSLI